MVTSASNGVLILSPTKWMLAMIGIEISARGLLPILSWAQSIDMGIVAVLDMVENAVI